MQRILIIQTAFIGDVVLATGIAEKLHQYYPDAEIDFLLRKGNEGLLQHHPFIANVLVWDKKQGKYANLWRLLKHIRSRKYDLLVNLQRFTASGILTAFSAARITHGFKKNPLSGLFTKSFAHQLGEKGQGHYLHETDRNHKLIAEFTDGTTARPRLYPTAEDTASIMPYTAKEYITIAPASVWHTKQYPKEKWVDFIRQIPGQFIVYLLGGKSDFQLCEDIRKEADSPFIVNLAGKLSFLQTAALMQRASMNYTNDSAPMHFASAMNAPVTAVYCSTIPEFGFGPLSDVSYIVEIKEPLECRPCGLHGYAACPLGHFKCAYEIETAQLLQSLPSLSL